MSSSGTDVPTGPRPQKRPGSVPARRVAPVAWRTSTLRRLLISLAVSQAGDWLYNLALLTAVYERTGSGALLGVTSGARILPMIVTGPLGGVLADRFDRRRLMIASDLLRAVFMLVLGMAVAIDLPVALFPVLAALSSVASAPYAPAVLGSIPRMVHDEDLPAANAARSVISQTSQVVGPLLGGVLVLLGPVSMAFFVNAASFAASAILVWSIRSGRMFTPPEEGVRSTVLTDLRAGLQALWEHPKARQPAAADVLESGVYGALTVLLLLIARATRGGAGGYALLLAFYGAGGVAGSAFAVRALRAQPPRRLTVLALLGIAGPLGLMAGLAGTSWFVGVIGAIVVAGIAGAVVEIQADTALQRELPDAVFGRAYGFVVPACVTAQVVGAATAPLLVASLGLGGALGGWALVVLAYTSNQFRAPPRRTP